MEEITVPAEIATHLNRRNYSNLMLCFIMIINVLLYLTMFSPRLMDRIEDTSAGRENRDGHKLHGELKSIMDRKASSVPGFFIFGDSTVDSGNNNFLFTLAKANMPPYGRDFFNHSATGRFSNGRISVDYLASFLGLPLIPAVLGIQGTTDVLNGLNYASAGAGILFQTGADLGQHLSFNEQLGLFSTTMARIVFLIGKSSAYDMIAKSIFYFSLGNNDFIHYYLRNVSGILEKQDSIEFSSMLLRKLSIDLKFVIGGGVRKIAFVGIGPLGCAPHFLYQYNSSSGNCVSEINDLVKEYNAGLQTTVKDLSMEFPDAKIIFCDIFAGFYNIVKNASPNGFENTSTACCGAGRYGGWVGCLFPSMACADSSKYVFWDAFHPTEKVNFLTALSIWNGTICSPMNLEELSIS